MVQLLGSTPDEDTNDVGLLALACDRCNLYKGPNISSVDPLTKQVVTLFNPRLDAWVEHFQLDEEALVVGLTPRDSQRFDCCK